jgi:holo-[acyl-carrier protein] synthase
MSDGPVKGIGVDLVENARIREMLDRWGPRLKDRVFLPAEQTYCETKACPERHYAGRFAVKESVTKAFGTGIGPHLGWLDVEVVRDEATGAPSVRLSDRAREWAGERGVQEVLISLSHTRNYAVAEAVLLG